MRRNNEIEKSGQLRRITGVQLTGQTPLLEQVRHGHVKQWCLWLAYNHDRTEGTWLTLHDDGMILRHTGDATGAVHTVVITPPEKKP
jgi:hypothetical protein